MWVAINNGDGTFQAPKLVIDGFGAAAGGWRVERHPRFVADLNGDGKADVLGFGNAGVWESLNLGRHLLASARTDSSVAAMLLPYAFLLVWWRGLAPSP